MLQETKYAEPCPYIQGLRCGIINKDCYECIKAQYEFDPNLPIKRDIPRHMAIALFGESSKRR